MTKAEQLEALALRWTDYATARPEIAGVYEWQVPSNRCSGMVVRVLAHFRERGAGYHKVLSPAFDHWDGWRVLVPQGTKWRPTDAGAGLKEYRQTLVCVEGLELTPCPFCGSAPNIRGVCASSSGGVVVTDNAHEFNSWWFECCSWVKTPRLSDPRELEIKRAASLRALAAAERGM